MLTQSILTFMLCITISGSLHPLHVSVFAIAALVINAFSGVHIRCTDVKLHRVFPKSLSVEWIEYIGKLPITEVRTVQIARFYQ